MINDLDGRILRPTVIPVLKYNLYSVAIPGMERRRK